MMTALIEEYAVRKLALLMLSNGLLACGVEDAPTAERAQAEATTVQIAFDIRPGVVVYRDGVDAPWQYAQRTSALNYQATVHGPYTVAYGCSDKGSSTITQVSRVPAEEPLIIGVCNTVLLTGDWFQATGRMAQPGRVMINFDGAETIAPNELFSIYERNGTYDVLSVTDTDIALRRGVVINGDTVIAPVIDTAAQGQPIRFTSFAASNALPSETLATRAYLETAHGDFFQLFGGSTTVDLPLAPDGVLAAGDEQSVSVRANIGNVWRAQRISARASDTTVAVLPAPLVGPTWSASAAGLAFDWTSNPAGYPMTVSAYGNSPNGTDFSYLYIEASAAYLGATGVKHFDLKPAVAAFKPAWDVDLSVPYGYDATFQLVTPDGAVNSAWTSGYTYPAGVAQIAPSQPRAAKLRHAQP